MTKGYLLGLDIGSSSVKASLLSADTGDVCASAFYPKTEAPILSLKSGWAEQDPEMWWQNMCLAVRRVLTDANAARDSVLAIGISYQMHGLVTIDSSQHPLRAAIIWCDSRALSYGRQATEALGQTYCLETMLNTPGNFTASKLAWVKDNEPETYRHIAKIMLPGDYIAMRLSGEVQTTVSGLSEGILWDFRTHEPAWKLMDYWGFDHSLLPAVVPTFGHQASLCGEAAQALGLTAGVPVTYRAGDQPNNALSLGVLNPGQIASTAGTSGVVYGVTDSLQYDSSERVNTFAHVNYTSEKPRMGLLLCINGTGILNAWMRRNIAPDLSYDAMNTLAATAPIGSDGVSILPFGNGSERVLKGLNPGCSIHGVDFLHHSRAHLLRAAQEGIVFAFYYGIETMQSLGMPIQSIHAGKANMFLSPLFRQTLSGISEAEICLYDTDGAAGAARGAGIGLRLWDNPEDAFLNLKQVEHIEPQDSQRYREAYLLWKEKLLKTL